MCYFEPTILGKSTPVTRYMLHKEFVELGQFNPVKLLVWFDQLVTKLEQFNIKPEKPKTPTKTGYINIAANWVKEVGDENNSTTIANSHSNKGFTTNMTDSDLILHKELENEEQAAKRLFSGESGDDRFSDSNSVNSRNHGLKLPKIKSAPKRNQNETMTGFELTYGEKQDYMNENRMLDFNQVRIKNYRNMLTKQQLKNNGGRQVVSSYVNGATR